MLNIKTILLPVDFPIGSLGVIHQAATLARHFHSAIVILHIVPPPSHSSGAPQDKSEPAGDLLTAIVGEAQKRQDQSLGPELDGITIRGKLVRGDPAWAIVRVAEEEKADLIMMPSRGFTFEQFLLGSATTKGMHRTACPVWTGAHAEGSALEKFAVRSVLCAVDLGRRSDDAMAWAAPMAAEFGARLTLVHVTAGAELWGPGGNYVNPTWKTALVEDASERIAKLQQDTGVKAEVFIGSGDVPKVLSQAATQTKADLLVTGCNPYGGHLRRTHGYGIICAVPIPVLNV
jgi:nucleotide-binding universal stress UspA family protein